MGKVRMVLIGGIVIAILAVLVLLSMESRSGSGTVAPPTPTVTIDQWDSQATNDTYTEVNRLPKRYLGQAVTWTCNVANLLGQALGSGKNVIGCWEYVGQYDGQTGEGEIILSVPSSFDLTTINVGDDLIVRGTIAAPYDGVHPSLRAYPGPSVDVWFLTDKGHDPNST